MQQHIEVARHITRRHFFGDCQVGLGAMGLASLLHNQAAGKVTGQPGQGRPQQHYEPRAKSVIYLHMAGSPPHLDLLDYKPELVRRTGEDCPEEFLRGKKFAFTTGKPKLLGSPHPFSQHGQSGTWFSKVLPQLASIADDLLVIRSVNTDQFNHAPAQLFLYTGSPRMGRPSLGSWVLYGLGADSQNLPGFVVLVSSGLNPSAGKTVWGSGFLPSIYQGVQCRSSGDPVLFVSNPRGMNRSLRGASLDAIRALNELQFQETRSPETATRIAQYELAFRMQVSVPGVMDISRESPKTLAAYGAEPGASSLANNCLLARRLVENGVRFVQLFDWGWDFHGVGTGCDIRNHLGVKAATMDRPVAALIRDLKQRGLLDETLVVWGGEFGRTPFREGRTADRETLGRDHYPDCFSMFMAGGGVKAGSVYGESDELGFQVVRDKVPIHDLQATILHLLGLDHLQLNYRYQGRDFRLTDVHGNVVQGLLA